MTGFASLQSSYCEYNWTVEIKSFNNKSLDLKLRVPDWIQGLENDVKYIMAKSIKRGSVYLNLKINNISNVFNPKNLNQKTIDLILESIKIIESRATDIGIILTPSSSTEVLTIYNNTTALEISENKILSLKENIMASLENLLKDFLSDRRKEGLALSNILVKQIQLLELLITNAKQLLPKRALKIKETIEANISTLTKTNFELDENKLIQELALLAIKIDVSEELDRLQTHIINFKSIIAKGGLIGRKLDFLMQECNREANTLCSKSQYSSLTNIGLEMKIVVDQIREQIQNLE